MSLVSCDTKALGLDLNRDSLRIQSHRVVVVLLQLPLLLLLPLGLHLHGLGDQVPQDGDRLGLADERVLNVDEDKR